MLCSRCKKCYRAHSIALRTYFSRVYCIKLFPDKKMLDYRLWTSLPTIIRKSRQITLPRGFDENFIIRGDLYFRNISDKCIHQIISNCEISLECYRPELSDEFFGYALTHQVLYIHILNKVITRVQYYYYIVYDMSSNIISMRCYQFNCPKNENFRKILENIMHDKCSRMFNEALYISNDIDMLKKYKDLFIEQSKLVLTINYNS